MGGSNVWGEGFATMGRKRHTGPVFLELARKKVGVMVALPLVSVVTRQINFCDQLKNSHNIYSGSASERPSVANALKDRLSLSESVSF